MKVLKLSVSIDETNLILAALSKLSYETSVSLIDNLKSQAQSQLIAEKVAEAETVEG